MLKDFYFPHMLQRIGLHTNTFFADAHVSASITNALPSATVNIPPESVDKSVGTAVSGCLNYRYFEHFLELLKNMAVHKMLI